MDQFQLTLQGKTKMMYEYYLVGSVLDSVKDGFLEILRGLCDNPENKPIEFLENEYIYSQVNNNGANVTLRAREVRGPNDGSQHCHLRYVGSTDHKMDKERKAMVRTYIDCLTSSNLNDYLQAIGFTLDAQLIVKGYLFHKGGLIAVVSKIYQLTSSGEMQPLTQSHLVEISCVVSAGNEEVADKLKKFGDSFKPYVRMDKMHQILEELNIN